MLPASIWPLPIELERRHHRHLVRKQRVERRAAALVRHVDHPELRGVEKHLHRQMDGAEMSGGAVGYAAGVVSHRRDEILQRCPRRRFLHRQDHRIGEHPRERHELVHLVAGRLALQAVALGNDGERRQRDHDRVAVGLGARDIGVPDPAARAALVLDHDVLPELLGQMQGERAAREVGGAARRERHHDRDRARRPRPLRVEPVRRERESRRGQRQPERRLEQLPAVCHSLPLSHFVLTRWPVGRRGVLPLP